MKEETRECEAQASVPKEQKQVKQHPWRTSPAVNRHIGDSRRQENIIARSIYGKSVNRL